MRKEDTISISYNQLGYFRLKLTKDSTVEQLEEKLQEISSLAGKKPLLLLELNEQNREKVISFEKNLKLSSSFFLAILHDNSSEIEFPFNPLVLDDSLALNSKIKKFQQAETMFWEQPLRSGMEISNEGDIVVQNFISENAEVISGHNIYVYGKARGKLIAGHPDNHKACIFVSCFDAQLISIAGTYRTFERNKLPDNILNKAAKIFLKGQNLMLEPLNI